MHTNNNIKRARECLQLMHSVCHQLDREKTTCRKIGDAAHAARQNIKALTDLLAKPDGAPPLAAADWIKSALSHLKILSDQVRQNRSTIDPQAWASVLLVQLNLPMIAKDLTA